MADEGGVLRTRIVTMLYDMISEKVKKKTPGSLSMLCYIWSNIQFLVLPLKPDDDVKCMYLNKLFRWHCYRPEWIKMAHFYSCEVFFRKYAIQYSIYSILIG